jgi:hypothetical protein
MFWFAGSGFHTVTCICVRCGRSSFRGFLCGCCRRGAADSPCGRVRSGRASERVHRGSGVCLRHTDRAPLTSAIPFHTHVFFSALCLWMCVFVGLLVCSWMMEPSFKARRPFDPFVLSWFANYANHHAL